MRWNIQQTHKKAQFTHLLYREQQELNNKWKKTKSVKYFEKGQKRYIFTTKFVTYCIVKTKL